MTDFFIILAIVIYLGGMIAIGAFYSKKTKNEEDFYLGGRKLGPLVTAMSAEASDMSAYLLMGIPGLALMTGLAEATWTAIGLSVGTYLNWLLVAKRLRKYTEKIDTFTLPEFFSKRFGDDKHILSVIAAVIIIIFFVPYTASGFSACGKLFSNMFGMEYMTAVLLSAAVIVIYCTLGGFFAASITDLIQSIVMTAALIVVVLLGASFCGGFGEVFSHASSMDGYLNLVKGFDVAKDSALSFGFIPIVSTLAWGLGYFGMPHILLRFMAIEHPRKLRISRRIASVWVVISMAIAIIIGVVGTGLVKNGIVGPYASSSAAETVIVDISNYISKFGWIAAFVAGIFISGILASTMSTADSQLIAASSSVTHDILVSGLKLKLSNKTIMIMARISVILISVVAVFLARDPDSSVFRIVSFAWAGFGATFGPLVLCALFWKRTNKWGALAGLLSGGIMIFVWKFIVRVQFAGTALDIYELLPAFIVALIAIVAVSLLTPAPDKSVTDSFDAVNADITDLKRQYKEKHSKA